MLWWPYGSLFGLAFLAATLLPAQSELELGAWVAGATAGNVMGSLLNWAIGRFLHRYRGSRWFPIPENALARAERSYGRRGYSTLLLSWVPVIGDGLALVAGLLRTPMWLFLALVTFAKRARYLAVAGLMQIGL